MALSVTPDAGIEVLGYTIEARFARLGVAGVRSSGHLRTSA